MIYGFRLFVVSVASGPAGYSELRMETVGDDARQHYIEHVEQCLDVLEKWSTLTGAPSLRRSARLPIKAHRRSDGDKGDPRIRFLRHTTLDAGEILFHVEYGRVGRYPKALARKVVDDAQIEGLATGHAYRCLLMLPERGKTGLLAVEDVSSTTPARIIPNWLSRASDWRVKKVERLAKPRSVRLMAKQVKDLPRLREMIRSANDASLRLTKKTLSGSGKRKKTKVKLEYKLDTKADRDDVMTWAERFAAAGDAHMKGSGVAELTEIVDGSLKTVGFTDAVVVIKVGDSTKKVSASKLDDLFVYPVSADRPDDDVWVDEVMSVVSGIQTWLQVDVLSAQSEEEAPAD